MPKAKQTKTPPAISERPHKNLSQSQEEIADICSDIVLNGGAREDVSTLLTILARHSYMHRSFARGRSRVDHEELAASAERYAARMNQEWYVDLAKHWSAQREETKDEPAQLGQRPVTEMVRANIRESLREAFDEFLADSDGIEPAWLLHEIIDVANGEKDLAIGIRYALRDSSIYVRVPAKLKARVEDFVKFLEGAAAA